MRACGYLFFCFLIKNKKLINKNLDAICVAFYVVAPDLFVCRKSPSSVSDTGSESQFANRNEYRYDGNMQHNGMMTSVSHAGQYSTNKSNIPLSVSDLKAAQPSDFKFLRVIGVGGYGKVNDTLLLSCLMFLTAVKQRFFIYQIKYLFIPFSRSWCRFFKSRSEQVPIKMLFMQPKFFGRFGFLYCLFIYYPSSN